MAHPKKTLDAPVVAFHTSLKRLVMMGVCVAGSVAAADGDVDFVRDIKPLLSDRCFLCHGPAAETRQAELRLDSESGATARLLSDSDRRAVVPGDPGSSELVDRITTSDPDLMMPPPDSGLSLTGVEKRLLRDWIADGAEWKGHWAFETIQKPDVPDVQHAAWCQTPIDPFIVAAQERENFPQNPLAAKERLIRRASFDLTGLPPQLKDIDNFLNDDSTDAFETVIDRLLASPQFGERMAADWLDVARYSDTYGYQVDRDRFVWPWRDWVVQAFNDNMPYDQFVIEQLAGDLLPNASRDQILATTFNRLHPQKVEGGSVPEEFRVEYVADRSQTAGTAFLGLTFECCRCHDHKYDPLSQREYFQMFSFFNNVDEAGLYSFFTNSVPTPTLALPTAAQEQGIAAAQQKLTVAEQALRRLRQAMQTPDRTAAILASLASKSATLLAAPETLVPGELAFLKFATDVVGGNKIVESSRGKAVQLTGDHPVDVKTGNFARWQPFTVSTWLQTPETFERAVVFHRSRAWTDAASRGYELLIEDGRLSAALIHFYPGNAIRVRALEPLTTHTWQHVTMTYDGSSRAAGLKLWLDGNPLKTEIVRDNLYRQITGGGGDTINIGQRFRDIGFAKGLVDDFRVFDRELTTLEIRQNFDETTLADLLTKDPETWNETERSTLVDYAAATGEIDFQNRLQELQAARKTLYQLQDRLQEIMVMRERSQPRATYILARGAYDAPAEAVTADVPAALPAMTDFFPRNRLGLAQWMVAPENPLTARVAVNRLWQMCFGHGLVRSPEDFGSQGMQPTHPQLLDWLAADFREHGWDVKRFLKQVLLSSTYQQSSQATADQLRRDPENVYLSRAAVFRLTAEMLRDNALAVSGLLESKIGGPPVRPYELAAAFKPSKPDTGSGLYRRSLYTYWKRTAPAPMMMTLDASTRDVCQVKRERTASPLQALVVLNGPQFVEASRALADRLLQQHGDQTSAILTDMFRLLTGRVPSASETQVIIRLYEQQLTHFLAEPAAAKEYLSVGESRANAENQTVLAAWATVANTLLAFDECMMRR